MATRIGNKKRDPNISREIKVTPLFKMVNSVKIGPGTANDPLYSFNPLPYLLPHPLTPEYLCIPRMQGPLNLQIDSFQSNEAI